MDNNTKSLGPLGVFPLLLSNQAQVWRTVYEMIQDGWSVDEIQAEAEHKMRVLEPAGSNLEKQ
jgi:hypothetical protein